MRNFLILTICLLLCAPAAHAQQEEEDGGGFLTRTIEGALSGAGREVNIVGFAGALSSEATFDRMTIADDQGIWLTLEDVSLIWSRTALLRGRLQVDSLTARMLRVERLPQAQDEPIEIPAAEAEPFSLQLPDLPVSVNIDAFEVAQIDLGEPIVGIPVQLALNAAARLDDEGLFLDLTANRIDARAGAFALKANVLRDGAEIELDLALNEAPEGIAARLLNLPDLPSVDLKIAGVGQLDDFTADIALATADQPRLQGQVILSAEAVEDGNSGPDRRIRADVGGDITALIAPEYQAFFGPDVGFVVNTLLEADGGIDVQEFALNAQALELGGQVRLNEDLWPAFMDIEGEIAQGGAEVVLPGSGAGVTVTSVKLDVSFDEAQGDALKAVFDIRDIVHAAARVERLALDVDGILDGTVDAVGRFVANITVDAAGLEIQDGDIAEALGDSVRAGAEVTYVEDTPIEIADLVVSGPDFGLKGDVVIEGLDNGFPTQLRLDVTAADLSRFAALAGRPLSGAADLSVFGDVTPLSSMFDLTVVGQTRDVTTGIAEADALLKGRTALSLAAARDTTGTFVRDLLLKNDVLDVAADVVLRSRGSDVKARVRLSDIALLVPEYQGAVALEATAQQGENGWTVDAALDAPYDSRALVSGLATGPDADLTFDISVPEVKPLLPSASGPLRAQGRLWQSELGYEVDVTASGPFESRALVSGLATGPEADLNFDISMTEVKPLLPSASGPLQAQGRLWQSEQGYQIDVTAGGPFDARIAVEGLATGPDARVTLDAGLPDMGVFIPELAGALALTGEVARAGEDWALETLLEGPSGMAANIAGTVAGDGSTVDLGLKGQVPLGLSGPFLAPSSLTGPASFDLAVRGAPSLDALSGRITTSNAAFSDPNLRIGLQKIATRIDLAQSRMQLDLGADIASGGRLQVGGSLGLATLAADLSIALRDAAFTDQKLYAAFLEGDITVKGPLTGGARIAGDIDVQEVNLTVPGTGVTTIGAIPEIRHRGASGPVTNTRDRAGVIPRASAGTSSGGGPAFPLAVNINAPSKIFIRGRGINAEMGGDLQIRGNTNNIISSGSLDLIRGRLDIIGKRFELDEGSVQFQGAVTPYILFVTTTDVPDGTASITVEGIATEPEITFSAVPEAPEDEVLSLILFGRYISELSAFQALQLANGISQLTGRASVNVIGTLRDGVGLDELDVTTAEDGSASVTAGKYITDDIYTDVTTNSEKGTDISLNIDLTESLKGKATVAEDGNSSIGLFFERDY